MEEDIEVQKGVKGRTWSLPPPPPPYTCTLLTLSSSPNPTSPSGNLEIMRQAAKRQEKALGSEQQLEAPEAAFLSRSPPCSPISQRKPRPCRQTSSSRFSGTSLLWAQTVHFFHAVSLRQGLGGLNGLGFPLLPKA